MALRLARMSGRVNVDNMLAEMSTTQFAEWIAYYQRNPEAEHVVAAYLRELIAKMHNAWFKKPKAAKDFLIEFGPKKRASAQDVIIKLKSTLRALAAGTSNKKKDK